MKPARHLLLTIVLGAWAASLACADARPRGVKHAVNPAQHVGQQHRVDGVVGGRGIAQPGTLVPGKNAIGVAMPPAAPIPNAAGRGTSAGATAAKANAIGAHVGVTALPPSAPPAVVKLAPAGVPANAVHPPVPASHATISGTGMARPGSASGVIGGPAKIATGLNGT